MAAVLAAGTEAVLSHASAAALWGLTPSVPQPPDVTVPRSSRSTPCLRRHCSFLAPDEVAKKNAIPVTCVARTLFDMAGQSKPWEFERLVREAEFLKLPQAPSLTELYTRHPRRRGARLVRLTLEGLSEFGSGATRSPLEDRFLRFVRRAGLPMPETNVRLQFAGVIYEVDCLWRKAGVIVELDGHMAHGTRAAFEGDRERDRRMQVAGWRVIRVTWRQLQTPGPLARDLGKFLTPVNESAIGRSRAA
jgi:very-short-patch-repair endonuclease